MVRALARQKVERTRRARAGLRRRRIFPPRRKGRRARVKSAGAGACAHEQADALDPGWVTGAGTAARPAGPAYVSGAGWVKGAGEAARAEEPADA